MDGVDEERRVDLKPALAEMKATLGEQGRLLAHLLGKIDKIVDLVTEAGKWQAGHQAMTGEHDKVLDHLGCQASELLGRLGTAEKRIESHDVKIGVIWAIVGALGLALIVFGVKVFGEHVVKSAVLMTGGGTALAAVGWERAVLAFRGLL